LINTHECLGQGVLGFRVVNTDPDGRYRIIKEIIANPRQPCLLVHTRLEADPNLRDTLRMFALLAPHLGNGGRENSAHIARTGWGDTLVANRGDHWLALRASVPFSHCSCGFVGATDGWQDISRNLRMTWEFDCALRGNIALVGELDLSRADEFVLALGFGDTLGRALYTVAESLGTRYKDHRSTFVRQWDDARQALRGRATGNDPRHAPLYDASVSVLLAHEDKTYDGALIASLSIPWGEAKGDGDTDGYHLVWTRDLCQSVTGLLAAGNREVPLRALIYLACVQNEDGSFARNFWIDGTPHGRQIQLDEVAFPVMLARRLHAENALQAFDPYPMVLKAAACLITSGPVTPQERWEEQSGYSPSTLAAQIAALVCAGAFARERGHDPTADFLERYADFLESNLERWTVTSAGSLVPDVPRHFIRIHPADPHDPQPDDDPDHGVLTLRNLPPGEDTSFPARDIIDGGFLELVRYGVRQPGGPLFENSLRVIDALLKVDTPHGPCWRRYNHDGYGQQRDGGPFESFGYGHAWPLLTGERGHYELACGRDANLYLSAMERFATSTHLLPEQVWSLPDRPDRHMRLGGPTGGAMPLCWAHAEYIKLTRSIRDGRAFDLIQEVSDRYRDGRRTSPRTEVWTFNHRARSVRAGAVLRVLAEAPFRLRWTADEWAHHEDAASTRVNTGHSFVDIAAPSDQRAPIRFTFFWMQADKWEGRDFEVGVESQSAGSPAPSARPGKAAIGAKR
jgi:glucoamylase